MKNEGRGRQGFIPLENIGVRSSAKAPGERILPIFPGVPLQPGARRGRGELSAYQVIPPGVHEIQPRSALEELQIYLADRQALREAGHFVAAGRERRIDIPRADAIRNDLWTHMFQGDRDKLRAHLPGNGASRTGLWEVADTAKIMTVFSSYAIEKMSPDMQYRVLVNEESKSEHRIAAIKAGERRRTFRAMEADPTDIALVKWLLDSIGVPFEPPAPEGDGNIHLPFASLLLEMRARTTIPLPQRERSEIDGHLVRSLLQ